MRWIRCALNQHLSGLAFSVDPTADAGRQGVLISLLATQRERGFADIKCDTSPRNQWLSVTAQGKGGHGRN